MSFLGGNILQSLLQSAINPFNQSRASGANYELSLGNEAYLTDSDSGRKEVLNQSNNQIEIKSGQFALLLTEEKVTVPNDKIAFISIKAGQKFKGLINISGFHVDPGFSGKLIFSVYNAGPSSIVLEKGRPYFMIWFSELNGNNNYSGSHQGQANIPATHIEKLKGRLASPNVVMDRISSLEKDYGERITKAEGNNTNRKWMLGVLITLLVGLNLKQYYDASKYNDGYINGLKEKTIREEIKKELDNQIKPILHKLESELIDTTNSVNQQ